jgi:hypothetical protein
MATDCQEGFSQLVRAVPKMMINNAAIAVMPKAVTVATHLIVGRTETHTGETVIRTCRQ